MDFDTEHGIKGLVYSVIAYVVVKLFSDITKSVWAFINRNKGPSKEQFSNLTVSLESAQKSIDEYKGLTLKMSRDLRRNYLFLKVIAGDRWKEYRQQVEEIEKEEKREKF